MMDEELSTLEDLFAQDVDLDAARKTEEEMLSPAGTYETVPPLAVTKGTVQDGKKNAGRRTIRFFGKLVKPKTVNAEGEVVTPEVVINQGFVISPDKAYKDDGKPDNPSKLWANAVRAFTTAYSAPPRTPNDVADYVASYPLNARLIQMGVQRVDKDGKPVGAEPTGEPGNLVVSLSAPRPE